MKLTDLDPNVVPEIAAPPEGGREDSEQGAPEHPQFGRDHPGARQIQAALSDHHRPD